MILADVLRRAGRLEEAQDLCSRALRKSLDDFLARLIEFELQLIEQGDQWAHAIDEVSPIEDFRRGSSRKGGV